MCNNRHKESDAYQKTRLSLSQQQQRTEQKTIGIEIQYSRYFISGKFIVKIRDQNSTKEMQNEKKHTHDVIDHSRCNLKEIQILIWFENFSCCHH